MEFIKKYFAIIAILLLSYFAIKPLFETGFFPMHDDTQVARVFEMGKSLKDGMLPVRWIKDLGYGFGYPIFNFYAPLAYYVGGFFVLFGFDALLATKAMVIVAMLLSGISMYVLAKLFFGRAGGMISSLFYMYAPYHALDLFVRGDIAELYAYAFIPLAFYGIFATYEKRKWKYVFLGAFAYAGVILSHNLTAMMITPFLLGLFLILFFTAHTKGDKTTAVKIGLPILLGLTLSAFYVFPALSELRYTNVISQIGGTADYKDHFVCINQFWDSPWGFGGSAPGCVDGMSFRIGKLHIIFSILAFLIFVLVKKKEYMKTVIMLFSFSALLICIFLMLLQSQFIWHAIPPMVFLQYPWRFLLLVSFFSSLIIGNITEKIPGFFIEKQKEIYIRYAIVVIIAACTILFYGKLFSPQTTLAKNSSDYTNREMLTQVTSRVSDEYMPMNFKKPTMSEVTNLQRIIVKNGKADILIKEDTTQNLILSASAAQNAVLQTNIAYFPAWKVFIDGNETQYNITSQGFTINLPQGKHFVSILFKQTTIEILGDIISCSAILLIAAIIYNNKKRRYDK